MSTGQNADIKVTLEALSPVADGILELQLVADHLPAWEAGAHIDLVLPSGVVRQYSLCGDPLEHGRYTVSVLRDPQSRGGSQEIHEKLSAGQELVFRGPRNHFPLGNHDGYLFFAGGIGITPILAMARKVAAAGKPWRLVYGGRTISTMAYLEQLQSIENGRVDVVPQDTAGYPDIEGALGEAGTWHVYACGPEPMLRAIEEATVRILGADRLHFERFGADPDAVIATDEDESFEVELALTGVTLTVGPEDRLIDVVRTVVPNVPFSCEEGYCGSCETAVLCGTPLHRDQVLSADERASNDTMMICVGRSTSPVLTLDI